MAQFPFKDLLDGTRRLFTGLQAKKNDGSMESLKSDGQGALLTQVTNDVKLDGVSVAGGRLAVQTKGSYVRRSTDPKPQGEEGNTLYLWDTKEAFIHDGTDWREV